MSKEEFLRLMRFPPDWETLGMYPDELFEGQVSLYKAGDEDGAEHDRNGAFHWWLRRNPTRDQLEALLRLAVLDPDPALSEDVRTYIRKAKGFDSTLAALESKLLAR